MAKTNDNSDFDRFLGKVASIAKSKAILAGGSTGFALGSATVAKLGLPAFFIAAPAAPGLILVGGAAAGAYAAYKLSEFVFGPHE